MCSKGVCDRSNQSVFVEWNAAYLKDLIEMLKQDKLDENPFFNICQYDLYRHYAIDQNFKNQRP